jgi:hypothetical protein
MKFFLILFLFILYSKNQIPKISLIDINYITLQYPFTVSIMDLQSNKTISINQQFIKSPDCEKCTIWSFDVKTLNFPKSNQILAHFLYYNQR